ncbi:MAG: peptide ABC transporter substrate-binding protein [Helicobacteraceae bacterium]|nr:peptide ABC transporter substrate-binding protein [Helicobacteraceae bacterium]
MKFIMIIISLTFMLYSSTLNLTISSNPSRLNPLLATDSASSEITNFLFNALVKYDKHGKEIIGDLAESYYFENNVTLIFTLKKNVKWHDGVPFSAKDVKFTYELITSPKVVTPYSSSFRMVKDVEVLDKYRVKVTYKEPYFKALETWMSSIVPKHILEKEKNIMSSSFNKAPVGTGAYKLKKLEFSKAIELVANDEYFEGRAKIDKITFSVIADPMTRFLMLKDGGIDVGNLTAMQLDRQVDEKFFLKYRVIKKIAHAYTYLGFNLRLEKFKDLRVRQALSLAIDRDQLMNILFFKYASKCSGPFLPGSAGFNKNIKVPQKDLLKAKKLLSEAGYSKLNPLEFEISTSNSNSTRVYAAQIMQQQLSKIGVKVTLKIMEWQAFLNTVVFPRKFETVLLGWSLSLSPDPYLLWHSDNDKVGGFNFIGFHNKKVDTLIEQMQTSIKREQIATFQQEIFKEIVDEVPYLFLFIPHDITVVDQKIKRIEPTINGIWHNYKEWEKVTIK